jgi:hypothetical protein
MDSIKVIAEFFLISLSLTYTLFSPIASSSLTGNGFIRLISNLSIGALVISLVINFVSGLAFTNTFVILKIVSLISLIVVSLFHKDDRSVFMWLLYGLISILLSYHIFLTAKGDIVHFAFLYGSSLLLGIITYSMTLGHWYLVVPKLSEKPLVKAALITWLVLIVKVIISTKSILANMNFFAENTTLGSGYAFNWMLLLMRTLFGYVVILGMSYFNWRLVRMRSIQSSTGILYAMTFFVFIGELISSFMFFNYGLLI